ncbi:MAG: cytochrome c/FTR1 family iron permease, partial [Owenweeksia sp.]
EIAPKRWPSLKSGQKLFTLHCQSCHGFEGMGDGPLAAGLEPSPTNFHDDDKANGLSPFQAYNTIRLGVENTGMRAFNELNDDEVWDLAFYVLSLPHQGSNVDPTLVKNKIKGDITLEMLASLDNKELQQKLQLDPAYPSTIASLRLFPHELAEDSEGDYLDKAKRLLQASADAYSQGRKEEARTLALTAYLEGVEPVEVQLRANDAGFVARLEGQLAEMRSSIERDKGAQTIQSLAAANIELLNEAQVILSERSFSGWLAFLLSSSIILREGLEAFLVIITILGIIRALKLKNAAVWIHSGWIAAILSGFLMWLAADHFFTFSGAQREIMEGAIALFAVFVLLYVGFWMHSKSEAGKWQAYVKTRIQGLAKKENMFGLALLSFLVVFREAFESVLFLSALNLEIGESHQLAFGGGIVFAFLALALISVLLLKYSRKLPITKLFRYSSMIIAFLAVVLVGKGVHAIQEAGTIGISTMPMNLRLDWIGLYPTWETFLSQLAILALIIFLWNIGNRSRKKSPSSVQHQAG